jgi:ribosomal protein S18 acetylase RimI-like enzyme
LAPSSDILLREATGEDAPSLVAVIHAAFEEYRGVLQAPSGAHGETEESLDGKLRTARAVLAFVDREAAGCVFYERRLDHLYLSRLGVIPAFRSFGIGRALVEYVQMLARDSETPRVRLGTRNVLTRNRAWYARLGYREIGAGEGLWNGRQFYVMLEKELTACAPPPRSL